MTEQPRRAPVQGSWRDKQKPGTISWDEHVRAHKAYVEKWRSSQSAERIAERGGFSYDELVDFLGHEPETWEER